MTSCPRSVWPSLLCRFRSRPFLPCCSPFPPSVAWPCFLSCPRLCGSSSWMRSDLFFPCFAPSSCLSYFFLVRVIWLSFEGSWTDPYSSFCGPLSDYGCVSCLWIESASCGYFGNCGSHSSAMTSVTVCVSNGTFSSAFLSVKGSVTVSVTGVTF